jgi:exopolysaccharide biosynthesis polyprenyl glycosylphosphotransferase
VAVADDARVASSAPVDPVDPLDAVDPGRTHGDIRLVLAITAVLDVMVVVVAVILGWDLRIAFDVFSMSPLGADPLIAQSVPWVIGTWIVALAAQGAYSSRNFGAGPDEYRTVTVASVVTAGLVAMTCYLLQLPLSRGFLLLTFLLGIPLLLVERFAVRKVVHRMRNQGRLLHRVIAIGGPSGVAEVVDSLRRAQYVGYRVVGACVPDGLAVEPERIPVPVLGSVADTRRLCREYGADTVLVARGGYSTSLELRRIAWDLEGSAIELVVVPSLTDVAGPRIHMRPVAGLPLLHLEQPQAGEAGGFSKRAFDVAFASLALVALAPVLVALAVLVKLQDGGPVLFRQSRVGRGGATFSMLKLRSMVVDAEQHLASLLSMNEFDGVLFKMKQDPRITPLGRVLRRYSLDEIPQLLNVLRGEMSLVGPRPPLSSEVDRYADDVHRRLLVRPGLTGLWQVSGRSGLSWDESVRLDLYYVDNWSMTTDLVIIAKTVRAVLGSSGAY